MAEFSACPSTDELQQMVLGQMANEVADRIQKHLEACPKCWSALDKCVSSDEFLEAARTSRPESCDPTKTMYLPVEWIRSVVSTWMRSHDSTQSDTPALSMADVKGLLAPPQAPDEIGRIADFRVLRVLGVGGMAVVFEAEDCLLKRRVALKLMRPSIAANPGSAERFRREAQSAAALKHEHVVSIHQVGIHGETPFIALELLRGETLENFLIRNGQLSVHDVIRIGLQIAMGLAAAHRQGLVHRDIKPANIWLEEPETHPRQPSAPEVNQGFHPTLAAGESGHASSSRRPAGNVKILDFGCAKAWTEESGITYPGLLIGTPAYMAPEQLTGDAVDPRADLFSLGCLLYRMAGAKPPFGGNNVLSVVRALALEEPAPLTTVNPQTPPPLSELVGKLLSKSPEDRPATAQSVVDQLSAIERSLPADQVVQKARTGDSSRELGARRSRRRMLTIGVGLALALLLLGLFFGAQIVGNKGQGLIKVDDPAVDVTAKESRTATLDRRNPAETNIIAAKAVLTAGGTIEIRPRGTGADRSVKAIEQLPREPFQITVVNLAGAKSPLNATFAALIDSGAEGLVSLDLSNTSLSDGDSLRLKELTHLRHLVLEGTIFDGPNLERVGDLTNLEELVLSGTKTTDADLAGLGGLIKLTSLELDRTQVTDIGLAHVSGLRALKTLTLKKTAVTDAGLTHLEGLSNLKKLVLEGTRVSDDGLAHLRHLPALSALDLTNTLVTDAGLEPLRDLTQLESLRLNGTHITDAGLALLPAMKKLHVLMLEWTPVTDAGLKQLEGLPQLDRLWLRGTRVTDAGLPHLRGLKRLNVLDLSCLPVTDAGLGELRTHQSLQHLVLDRTRVTNAGLVQLKSLTRLYTLYLGETRVTEAGLIDLKELTNLRVLGLAGLSGVSDTVVPRIVQLHSLEHVDLRNTHVSAKGFGVLKVALPNLVVEWSEPNYALARAVLEAGGHVDVHLEEGSDHSVQQIGELPAELFQITGARLAGSRQKLNELLTAMVNSRLDTLVSLDLSGTVIDDADLDRLKPLVALQELNLAETRITDAGLAHLKGLTALRRVVLDGDAVRGSGLMHLSGLPKLTELRLGCPALSDVFLIELGGLQKLQRLSLAKSNVADEGAKYLAQLSHLKELDLSDTKVTRVAELQKALPQCRMITSSAVQQLARP
jgi:serine/threonine protein kinase/Leucine-rich repeat (LRR) protein